MHFFNENDHILIKMSYGVTGISNNGDKPLLQIPVTPYDDIALCKPWLI